MTRAVDLASSDAPLPIRVARLGALAFLAQPENELGFLVDVGGPVNRPPSLEAANAEVGPPAEVDVRLLLSPGVAAELVVAVLNAARAGGDPSAFALVDALDALGYAGGPPDDEDESGDPL